MSFSQPFVRCPLVMTNSKLRIAEAALRRGVRPPQRLCSNAAGAAADGAGHSCALRRRPFREVTTLIQRHRATRRLVRRSGVLRGVVWPLPGVRSHLEGGGTARLRSSAAAAVPCRRLRIRFPAVPRDAGTWPSD
eukprot:scaffold65059_cov65-Phaeocystis_antarctica.AAC.2